MNLKRPASPAAPAEDVTFDPEVGGRGVARNTLLNLAGLGIPLATALVTLPLIVPGLGPERFGILALAWVIFTYFSLLDLGLGRATTRFVAEALVKGETRRVPALVWTTAAAQGLLGIGGGLVLAAATPLLVDYVLTISPGMRTEARASFSLLALSLPAVLISGSLIGTLEAAQRFDLTNGLKIPFNVATYVLPLLAVRRGWDLPAIVALLVASRWLLLLAYGALSVRVLPALRRLPRFDLADLRPSLRFGGWMTVSIVLGPLLMYLDRFFIGAWLGVAAVTYYAVPFDAVVRLRFLPGSLAMTLFPALSALMGRGRWQEMDALASQSMKLLLAVMGLLVMLLMAYGRDLLAFWMGADFARQAGPVVQILVVGLYANSLALIPHWLLLALGRSDITARIHLAEVPVHIVVVWLLVHRWGIAGAAAAWSLRCALDAVLHFAAVFRLRGMFVRTLAADAVPQTALAMAGLGALVAVSTALFAESRVRWLVLPGTLIAGMLAALKYLREDERVRLARFVREIRRPRDRAARDRVVREAAREGTDQTSMPG